MDETRKSRGILFSAPMVLKLLSGEKTQTRRLIKGNPANVFPMIGRNNLPNGEFFVSRPDSDRVGNSGVKCPHGAPGDRLWVRETWCLARPGTWAAPKSIDPETGDAAYFRAGWERSPPSRWCPSIFMPRWASRITLEITEVRVQRLQDISEEDAKAEGVERYVGASVGWRHYGPTETDGDHITYHVSARDSFVSLWDSINEDRAPWDSNPWVWALTFRRIPQETNP